MVLDLHHSDLLASPNPSQLTKPVYPVRPPPFPAARSRPALLPAGARPPHEAGAPRSSHQRIRLAAVRKARRAACWATRQCRRAHPTSSSFRLKNLRPRLSRLLQRSNAQCEVRHDRRRNPGAAILALDRGGQNGKFGVPSPDNPVPGAKTRKMDDGVRAEEVRGMLAADPHYLLVANRADAVDALDHACSLRQMRFQPSHIRPWTPPKRRLRMIGGAPGGWYCCAAMPIIIGSGGAEVCPSTSSMTTVGSWQMLTHRQSLPMAST